MAIYHCSVKPISRGAGQSIVAAAAYRHGCKMENMRTGEIYDYSRKRGLESSSIYLPSGVNSSWTQDRAQLWNSAEAAEKRKDARLGREIILALPSELSAEQRRELTGEMARHLVERYGVAVDVAIHQPSREGDQRNHHAHMLMSSRRITPEGFGEKARELDDREHGPAEVEHIRSEWARLANRALEKAGQQITIDHRSFQRQGVNRIPTLHLGASANALERRGIQTRIGDRNRSAQVVNARVKALEKMERPRHDPVPEKTQPRTRSLSEIRTGMAAFVGSFTRHKKKAEEAERQKQERRQQAEKRRKEAVARIMAMEKRVPEDRLSSNVDMAYAGYFSAWRQETAPAPPWTADTLRQADAYITARLIAEGRDFKKITATLEKHSPAAGLSTEPAYAERLVAWTAERPDVQEQRKEAQEREQERERQRQEQRTRRSMSLGR